jgi:hypothetical protein
MNEHDLEALERRLRTLPPLLSVPHDLVERSLRVGAAHDEGGAHAPARLRWFGGWRLRWSLGAAAVAATTVVIAFAVTSVSNPTGFRRTATLAGAGHAAGYVAVGPSDGALEPVVVSIKHLRPAAPHHYYEIWFQTGTQQVPGVTFNPDANGTAEIRFTAPSNTQWVRCWVTRQSLDHPRAQTIVMRATLAPQPA